MRRETCIVTALALAFAGPAWAHNAPQRGAKDARSSALQSDSRTLARCGKLHHTERVQCLHQARGGTPPERWVGATSGMAGGTAGGSFDAMRTPSQPNETQPGQSTVR